MRDLKRLNINVGGNPVRSLPPSENMVEEFQNKYSIKLPSDYLTLLNFSNGGHPELDTVKPSEGSDVSPKSIDHFLRLDGNKDDSESIWKAMDDWTPIIGRKMLVFAFDPGGNPFFIDTETTNEPVKYCLHDAGFNVVKVSSSFHKFIDSLEKNGEYI